MSSTSRAAGAFLALSCVGAIACGSARAQETETKLGSVTVTDTAIDEETPKVESAESPKYVRPLLDTPQTITVIGNQTIRQQNLLTLREALTTLPGITFGAGEGGGGYGDSINLRGQSANNDLQIDGVRDSAQYSRSDTFNLEQVEVVNGANSVYAGSGSIGGTINLVTKRPKPDSLTVIQGGVGTADYYRATVDTNIRASDMFALRLNAMFHRNRVPGREFDKYKRWGVAPSVTMGMDGPTSLTLAYVHQEDENTPIYGVPYYPAYGLGGLLPGASYSGYYGYKDVDIQDQMTDQASLIFEHRFNDRVSIRNLSRYQRVRQDLTVNPPQGTFCLADGRVANATATGAACAAGQLPGNFYPSGPRGNRRNSVNTIMFNQFDVRAVIDTGGIEHSLTVGWAYSEEDYKLLSGNVLRNPNAVTPNPTLPPINIANPDPVYGGPINFIPTSRQDGATNNASIYAFDAIKISDQIELNGGIRWERNKALFRSDTVSGTPGATLGAVSPGPSQYGTDELFSYRIGALFKPSASSSLYVAYGNSKTPTSSSVRGGCGVATAQQILVGAEPCGVAPQTAVNYEIGGKIDLAGGMLQLTAALFRNERTNYPVTSNDPAIGNLQVNDGRSRVDGIALGASGKITPDWSIFANYTYLQSKVIQSISNLCLANLGKTLTHTPPAGGAPITTTCPASDTQAGNPLTNTPKHSGSLFTTYTLPFGLQIGYGLTYQGSFLLSNTTRPFARSEDWLTHRAFVSYAFGNGMTAQINVQNFTDEKYFTGIRNNGWATPGEGRSAVLSLFYSF